MPRLNQQLASSLQPGRSVPACSPSTPLRPAVPPLHLLAHFQLHHDDRLLQLKRACSILLALQRAGWAGASLPSDGSRHGSPSCIAPSPCEAWSSRGAAAPSEFWPSSTTQRRISRSDTHPHTRHLTAARASISWWSDFAGRRDESSQLRARTRHFAELSRERRPASRDPHSAL